MSIIIPHFEHMLILSPKISFFGLREVDHRQPKCQELRWHPQFWESDSQPSFPPAGGEAFVKKLTLDLLIQRNAPVWEK